MFLNFDNENVIKYNSNKYTTFYFMYDYITEIELLNLLYFYNISFSRYECENTVIGMDYYKHCLVYQTKNMFFIYGNDILTVEVCKPLC